MIAGAREFFRTAAGKNVAIGLVVLGVAICIWSAIQNFSGDEAYNLARGRVFICAETKKPYNVELFPGMKIPYDSPHSGKPTGYPAELCYWTKDGKSKEDPTPVLLNSYTNQPEPTFCPDCGRMVVMRNPFAETGAKPPPTQAEFKPRNNRGG
jgi:hypothetical protein